MSETATLQQGPWRGGSVRGMDATLRGSLLPATLLSTHCELSCGDLGFGPLFPVSGGLGGAGTWGVFTKPPSKRVRLPCCPGRGQGSRKLWYWGSSEKGSQHAQTRSRLRELQLLEGRCGNQVLDPETEATVSYFSTHSGKMRHIQRIT